MTGKKTVLLLIPDDISIKEQLYKEKKLKKLYNVNFYDKNDKIWKNAEKTLNEKEYNDFTISKSYTLINKIKNNYILKKLESQ